MLNLAKRKSETPLQTIERYVAAHPELEGVKMTYAGRLDPMAEGVLVVLCGEKNKERDAYTGLDKDYEFEFMLGVETDTHDALGKVVSAKPVGSVSEEVVGAALAKYVGTFVQQYPAYSSKVVDGKPLFEHARQGRAGSIVMPTHEVEVKGIELLGARKVPRAELLAQIRTDVEAVRGDFRQKEILRLWDEHADSIADPVTIYKARVSCGSGFYVRQLVSDLGRDLSAGAVTLSILRTRVGAFELKDSIA